MLVYTKDIDNSLKILNNDGFIIMHDLLPYREAAATKKVSKTTPEWNGDVWQISFDLVGRRDITFRLVCSDFGCGIISKKISIFDRQRSYSLALVCFNLFLITFQKLIQLFVTSFFFRLSFLNSCKSFFQSLSKNKKTKKRNSKSFSLLSGLFKKQVQKLQT